MTASFCHKTPQHTLRLKCTACSAANTHQLQLHVPAAIRTHTADRNSGCNLVGPRYVSSLLRSTLCWHIRCQHAHSPAAAVSCVPNNVDVDGYCLLATTHCLLPSSTDPLSVCTSNWHCTCTTFCLSCPCCDREGAAWPTGRGCLLPVVPDGCSCRSKVGQGFAQSCPRVEPPCKAADADRTVQHRAWCRCVEPVLKHPDPALLQGWTVPEGS
jgi:hypothetical protein